jgi:hypothetical protein
MGEEAGEQVGSVLHLFELGFDRGFEGVQAVEVVVARPVARLAHMPSAALSSGA